MTLSEISQTQKVKHCRIPLTRGPQGRHVQREGSGEEAVGEGILINGHSWCWGRWRRFGSRCHCDRTVLLTVGNAFESDTEQ